VNTGSAVHIPRLNDVTDHRFVAKEDSIEMDSETEFIYKVHSTMESRKLPEEDYAHLAGQP